MLGQELWDMLINILNLVCKHFVHRQNRILQLDNTDICISFKSSAKSTQNKTSNLVRNQRKMIYIYIYIYTSKQIHRNIQLTIVINILKNIFNSIWLFISEYFAQLFEQKRVNILVSNKRQMLKTLTNCWNLWSKLYACI